jgi:hypothetical protein
MRLSKAYEEFIKCILVYQIASQSETCSNRLEDFGMGMCSRGRIYAQYFRQTAQDISDIRKRSDGEKIKLTTNGNSLCS